MKVTGLKLAQGYQMPFWYGAAYYSPYSDHLICYPIPLNLVVRWARALWWALKRCKHDDLSAAYSAGYEAALSRQSTDGPGPGNS